MHIDLTKAIHAEGNKQRKQTKMSKQLTDTEKACIAAKFLGTEWNEWQGKCIYTDDATGDDYICQLEAEMVDLYDLINDSDADTSRDAYSLWCSQTSHDIA